MYNSLSALPSIPYNILAYLATKPEANNLWKLLAYNGYDALSKPDLTMEQKLSLVWKTGAQEKYSVFFTNLVEDAIAESRCIFKLYNYMIQPTSSYIASVVYAFDFLYGGKMSLVEYNGIPVSRGDLFLHTIMATLNGAEIGGVGKLIMSDDLSRYCGAKSVIGNSKTFTGVCLYIGVMVGDTGARADCDG